MMELLQHLIPDFAVMFSGNTNGISAWFWLVTYGLFSLSLMALGKHHRHFKERLSAIRSLLDGQARDSLALNRREILARAEAIEHGKVGMLWREFDESLVLSSDQKHLYNTLDAEHFFNARTLAGGLTASRLMAAAPSFLVALGVLGTFVGLTVGLEGLVGATDEIEALKGGINKLISGAAVAFMTSVWGVTFSLLLNFLEKMFERNALSAIQDLQHEIDFLYPRIPAEQSLVHIAEYGKESKEALQELHERIGDRLQETLQGMNEGLQQALTDTLNNIMGPAIQSLVNSTSQQSSQVMEKLVGNFMDGMTSVGREQGQLMQQAAAGVNTAVGDMTERLGQITNVIEKQQDLQSRLADEQVLRFDGLLKRMQDGADARQVQLESRFSELVAGLTGQLKTQLDAASQRDDGRHKLFLDQLGKSRDSQNELLDAFAKATEGQLDKVTKVMGDQQAELQGTVKDLLKGFSQQVSQHGQEAEIREKSRQERFDAQLEQVSKQQQNLLAELASAVQESQRQSSLMADQHQQLLGQLKQASEATAASSKHMDSSANQLGLLSANVRSAAELLGQKLEQVTQRIEQAGGQNAELAGQLQQQAATLAQLQSALLEGAQRFEQAASEARNGFGDMKSTQQEFLTGVRHEFTALGETLRAQVEAIEKQAEEWLRSYASEVRTQIDDRMNKWNEVSLSYADQMHRTAQAMGGILDELEAR